MTMQEKAMKCFDCGAAFVFSVEEQADFQTKGYTNTPKRCPTCRETRKARQLSSGNFRSIQPGFRSERKLFPATCVQCKKVTQVPFEPREGRPVYCRECYSTIKTNK